MDDGLNMKKAQTDTGSVIKDTKTRLNKLKKWLKIFRKITLGENVPQYKDK